MIDRGVITEDAPVFSAEAPLDLSAGPIISLEQRVRRLEDALAILQDTRQLEERVVERVAERVTHIPDYPVRDSAKVLLSAGRQLLPAALGVLQAKAQAAERSAYPPPPPEERRWLVLEFYAEARSVVRMFLDPRYRTHLTWTTRIVPVVVLVFVLTSQWAMPWNLVPVLGSVLDKAVAFVLAFFVYKILAREARRYRETVTDLSRIPPTS